MKDDLRDFDHSLPMALLRAREAVMKEFLPSLRAHDLSPEQWRVIRALEQEDGLEIAEISRRCYLLPPSMSRIAQNLLKRGLVSRHNVASDQRRSLLQLSNKGRELFEQIAPESSQQYQAITEKFGQDNLEKLYQLLEDLVGALRADNRHHND